MPRPMRRGFLVTISGIDGSGKSSHTIALQENLTTKGLSVTRAWVGHKPMLSYPFQALVRLLGLTHRTTIQGVTFFWRDLDRNPVLSKLWLLFVSLDFFPKAILSVKIPLALGRTVVCDRYLYDLIAELSQHGVIGPKVKKIFLSLLPRPTIAFLIDVDEKLAWERSLVPGRAREQPIYDLGARRRELLRLAKELDMIVLNGTAEPERNRSEILNLTLEHLGLATKGHL